MTRKKPLKQKARKSASLKRTDSGKKSHAISKPLPNTGLRAVKMRSFGLKPFIANPVRIQPSTSQLPQQTDDNTIRYTVSLRNVSGVLKPYFNYKSYDPHPEMDTNFELRIRIRPDNGYSYVELTLDDSWNWEFAAQDALMLGQDGGDFYENLVIDPSGSKATFYANYNPDQTRTDTDPYYMTFLVYIQNVNQAPFPTPLVVTVDPDIKNPGDPP